MRISEAWLRELVNPPLETDRLVRQITMAGLEVDAVEAVAAEFNGVIIGLIEALDAHPDADRLRICRVNVGADEPLQIVTGAQNVYVGMRVPVAVNGAQLPGGLKIKPSKLRGVPSFGMLCSEKELGMAEASEGVMDLPADAPPGQNIRDYLKLDDVVIEVDLTPNRADCLSVEGIAREVAALNGITWPGLEVPAQAVQHDAVWPVEISAPARCPRYLGRLIEGVDPNAVTPLWMVERLRRAGLRSLGPVVDVTNYVLLELGQPLHAFDAERLHGAIQVRLAQAGETLGLLNDQTITLDAQTLVIADNAQPLALAGVMGGKDSAVGSQTTRIFLECAFFAPTELMGTARRYGLHTDSSHRFERGVDPELQRRAIERATQLIVVLAGGAAGPLTETVFTEHLPQRPAIHLRETRLQQLLGLTLPKAEVTRLLQGLRMDVTEEPHGWWVIPPSFRFDMAIEADLIEEVARIYGYDQLPRRAPAIASQLCDAPEGQLTLPRLQDLLVDRGYREVITYSFVDPALQHALCPDQAAIPLKNPISADMAVMRTTLWAGLLSTARHNHARQENRIRLFESGLRFTGGLEATQQDRCMAGLALGPVWPLQWSDKPRDVDFYDLKGDVEALLAATGRGAEFSFQAVAHPALHPGQSAAVLNADGQRIGWLGMLHPRLEKALDFNSRVFLFELETAALDAKRVPAFKPLSRFPSVRRDLALLVDANLEAGRITQAVRDLNLGLLQDVQIFDVYSGAGVESGKKSLALSLLLQNAQETLTDAAVDAVIATLLQQLAQQCGAKLRD